MDYAALAAQFGGKPQPAVDYSKLAAQFGGKPSPAISPHSADITPTPVPGAEEPGMIATLAGAIGKGVGSTALGAQKLVGQGLSKIGEMTADAPSMSDLVAGRKPTSLVGRAGQWLQQDADQGKANLAAELAPYKAANPLMAAIGETGGEVLATLPVGGALAGTARLALPAAAAMRGAPLLNAIASAGMRTGAAPAVTLAGKAVNMGTRAIGGGIAGGAATALIDPEQASTGAAIGAALPPALAVVGKAGNALGRLVAGPEVSAAVRSGMTAARGAGYVVPPTQASPTLANRLLEGVSGKITTAQNASAKNQLVTNGLAAGALGLPKGTQLTPDILNGIRQRAGVAYDAVASTGTINPGPSYSAALDAITAPAKQAAAGFPNARPNPLIAEIESLKSVQFDASSAVSKISQLRDQANAAYASGDKGMGKALKSAAAALEDAIDQHLQQIGAPADMLSGFREARQLIAKTYSVEKAMNSTTGTVDAQKLGAQLAKGKPLSGGLRTAAEFAQQFPKAAQPLEKMGSLPQLNPLDWAASGAVSAASANPLMMAGVMVRPAARSLALSPIVQNRLLTQRGPNALQQLAANPAAVQLVYRSGPRIGDR